MKIVHLNTFENVGGAAIAARRLHTALNLDGRVISIMGVKVKDSDAADVVALPCYRSKFIGKVLTKVSDKLVSWHTSKGKTFYSAYLLPNSLAAAVQALQPDIIHLHWIAGSFISPWVLKQIAGLSIKTVWTLHDTWAFTGGCHYYGACRQWQSQCRACPELSSNFPCDLAKLQWICKNNAYQALQPAIIGLSKKFTTDIGRSALLKNFQAVQLPNTIDTEKFRPIPKQIARDLLGLPAEGRYILFGACTATNDSRKGYDLLSKALGTLSEQAQKNTRCLVFGATRDNGQSTHSLPTQFLGILHDEIALALAYSAADVFVSPSREDNLPNTVMESLACGTPVVGFAVGGIPDMVEHKVNGMLATPHDPRELAEGIAYVLEDAERREAMGRAARRTVEEKYAYPVVAKQYISLYEQLLATR